MILQVGGKKTTYLAVDPEVHEFMGGWSVGTAPQPFPKTPHGVLRKRREGESAVRVTVCATVLSPQPKSGPKERTGALKIPIVPGDVMIKWTVIFQYPLPSKVVSTPRTGTHP